MTNRSCSQEHCIYQQHSTNSRKTPALRITAAILLLLLLLVVVVVVVIVTTKTITMKFEVFTAVMPNVLNLNVKTARSSETPGSTRPTTQRYTPEDLNLHDQN